MYFLVITLGFTKADVCFMLWGMETLFPFRSLYYCLTYVSSLVSDSVIIFKYHTLENLWER